MNYLDDPFRFFPQQDEGRGGFFLDWFLLLRSLIMDTPLPI